MSMNAKLLHQAPLGWLLLLLCASTQPARATDIAQVPLITSSPSAVRPNLMFIMDDSGSMDSNYLPDWANDGLCRSAGASSSSSGSFGLACDNQPPFRSKDFNGIYYNPAITYRPAVDASNVSLASQTAANTTNWTVVKNDAYNVQSTTNINLVRDFPDVEWCTDAWHTNCLRNGNYILPGTVGGLNYTTRRNRNSYTAETGLMAVGAPDAATTESRTFGPHYYTIIPAEYCDNVNLRNCQASADATFNIPAPLRWCSNDTNARAVTPAAGSCQAVKTPSYNSARYPTKIRSAGVAAVAGTAEVLARARFDVTTGGCSNTNARRINATAVTINGTNLLASATGNQTSSNNLASAIGSQINSGSSGYSASVSNNRITVTAPAGINPSSLSISSSRSCSSGSNPTLSHTSLTVLNSYAAATTGTPAVPSGFPGSFVRVDITPSVTSYPKASTRVDCAATTCTYDEEMTNFANWWTYYRTRMQTMKTAAGLAFANVSDQYRVGYITINNNTGSDFLNLSTFDATGKASWFNKLTAAEPSDSTPLRRTLSRVGRLYAGGYNGSSLNGVSVTDPMQFSCQKNFTILSTDGYWNETGTPTREDGSTAIGDQDSGLARPLLDGRSNSNTLADVAAYYYATDLRSGAAGSAICTGALGTDVCIATASRPADAIENRQSMTTFTLGFGATGYLQFTPDYRSATSGDYFNVRTGATANPSAGVCAWETSGATCNWPEPLNNNPTGIDDLWHAAVNGRGTYFSASSPDALYSGLRSALEDIEATVGGGAAAASSNLNLSTGDNYIFGSRFTSQEWHGELVRMQVNLSTLALNPTPDWTAASQLDSNASRSLFMFDATDTVDGLKPFNWASLSVTERAYFGLTHMTTAGALSQFCSFGTTCLSSGTQTAAAGEPLVAYLTGDRSNEGALDNLDRYFRQREHVLGDIVNSDAVYVKAPRFNYADDGYATYRSAQQTRQGIVYVGANDGMVHAFNADSGAEAWAYVPSMLLPSLYKLADKDYANQHRFYVNSSPVQADIKIGDDWHTILVGGLGAGGRGYYALDITDPTSPKALWEFTDNNLGQSFGKPEITKLRNGTWAVLLTSGYNNLSPGNGVGQLFILDAATGVPIRTPIQTSAGSTTVASGLAQISAWVESPAVDNTVLRAYGGDTLGNLWRFDLNHDDPADFNVVLLATLRGPDPAANAQPITTKPELAVVAGHPVVYVGTGRYLGASDLTDSSQQSIYAIKDTLGTVGIGNPRTTANNFVQQTLTQSTCPATSTECSPEQIIRTGSSNAVNFATNGGWFVDLPATRERAATDPQLVLGTLAVTTNVLDPNACASDGYSFLNYFDYRTGAPVTDEGIASWRLGDFLASAPNVVCVAGNCTTIIGTSQGTEVQEDFRRNEDIGGIQRKSWRELNTEY